MKMTCFMQRPALGGATYEIVSGLQAESSTLV